MFIDHIVFWIFLSKTSNISKLRKRNVLVLRIKLFLLFFINCLLNSLKNIESISKSKFKVMKDIGKFKGEREFFNLLFWQFIPQLLAGKQIFKMNYFYIQKTTKNIMKNIISNLGI